MIDKLDKLLSIRESFEKDHPKLAANNSDPNTVALFLLNEVKEAQIEIEKGDLSRIGDELADVFLYTIVLFKHFGLDVFEEVGAKSAYNCDRFRYSRDPNGSYEECKKIEKSNSVKSLYGSDRQDTLRV